MLIDLRQVPDFTGSGAKMAQVGRKDVFLKIRKKTHRNQKEKKGGMLMYVRMLTDQCQILDVTGSGAKMAQVVGPDFHNGFLNKI